MTPETQPTSLTAEERQTVLFELNHSMHRFLDAVSEMSLDQWTFKPDADTWSAAEVTEHLVLMESAVLQGLISKALKETPEAGQLEQTVGKDAFLLKVVPNRETKVKGPASMMPAGTPWEKAEAIEKFTACRQRTIDFAATSQEPLRRHVMAHMRLGPLDVYQWLLLIAGHNDRHRGQVEEVKAAAGYPA